MKQDIPIAHTFGHYLQGGDADWPLLMPMVKSASAAMDAVQDMAGAGKLGKPRGRDAGI